MIYVKLFLAVLTVVALTACSNESGWGSGNGNNNGDNSEGLGNSSSYGSISDQNSPAYFQQVMGDRVVFPVDEAILTFEATGILDQQASWLLRNTEYRATIEGHADERGTREYNLALGARRANAVREYLISRGVVDTRLQTTSYGKERPIEICSNETCYAVNRRAVTVLAQDLTS
ncbi:MAG: peptidoglycan-associated lipoprotein Pal [Aestuariivita sp.]|nr:peptidoglycan-associated lipoprotein Pal [Aestuariivita sp.]